MTLSVPEDDLDSLCRDRFGYFTKESFKISACSLCYFYLVLDSSNQQFKLSAPLQVFNTSDIHEKPFNLINISDKRINVFPSSGNRKAIDIVCSTLDDVECTRWTSCCESAQSCCELQTKRRVPTDGRKYCPQTFDGWSCWDFTLANKTVTGDCPAFLDSVGKGTRM